MPYRDLHSATAKIDARSTRYRFDLERDIPWDQLDAPGLHLGPDFLALAGIDPRLAEHPEAHALLQWSVGLEICRAFSALEQYLLDFVDAEHSQVGPTRSALLLYQEERKHIALFDRYGDHLAGQHPEWMADFEAAFAPCMPALLHPYTRDTYPEPAVQHYFFWLKTLFFEEYTIYLHDRLLAEEGCVQPAWLAVHRAHRREEHQHVITDAAYVDALDLSPTKRRACATAFWSHLEQTFDLFLGVAASRRLLRARFPDLAHLVPDLPTRRLPLFQEVLHHPLFRQTRRCAPGADRLVQSGGRLTDALDRVAHTERGVTFLAERRRDRVVTYAELRQTALGVTDALRRQGIAPGEVVIIPAGPPQETVPLFWGVQLGGMVAVLVEDRASERLDGIRAVLPDAHLLTDTAALLAHTPAGPVLPEQPDPDSLAIIQFSSGSTGEPRGVRLTHRCLLANIDAIIAGLGGRAEDVFVSWLPLSHDMGLIGYHLLPVVLGADQALMSTRHFLKRPMDWLVALDRLGGTVSASPDFGLALTVDRLDPALVADLDLSGLHCLLCGAEPIRPATLARFAEGLAPAGLRPEALTPAYGLAEATLCLTARPPGEPWRVHTLDRDTLAPGDTVREDPDGLALVGVGVPLEGVALRVVDAAGRAVGAGIVGEIEARGPSITAGYIGPDPRPADAFRGDWLRTGDLGVMLAGRLVITGRRKEMLIVSGQNLYAHDIEAALADIEGLHPRRVAALCDPITERLTIAAVIRGEGVKAAITRRLQERFGVTPARICAVRGIPRTSSGKIQRAALRAMLAAPAADGMIARVQAAWAEALSRPLDAIPTDADFRALGGTSIQAAHVHAILEDDLGPLPLSLLMESSTIAQLAAALRPYAPAASAPAARPAPTSALRPDDIAIIGMGLRLPGADTPEALWAMLSEGRAALRSVPPSRWDHRRYDDIGGGVGGFLDDIFGFDPAALGLSQDEAAQADPRHRLFLEVAAAAMQDAGVGRGRVGVFVSQGESPENCRSFLDDLARNEPRMAGRLDNSTNNMVAARVSRTFDLTGPAVVIQAACASSLVAVHQARRSLQHGECQAAIVGGVELLHSPTLYALFHPAGVLSPTGRCLPFTADADGFVPGEGAAAVVLKRLDDALRDGDRIRAVIRGSAIGNDGRAFSAMAPSPAGQVEVARRALCEAGVPADSIGMLEAHGTATVVGDAVELRAMGLVYGGAERAPAVTSVKSNLGHLLAAAGITALIKATLSLEHGVIPPIAGFTAPSPRADGALSPAAAAIPWSAPVRRAALNALGIGGTNCHVIIEQAPVPAQPPPRTAALLCLSDRTDDGLIRRAAQLAAWLPADADRDAVAAALSRAAVLHPRRIAAVVHDTAQIRRFLAAPPAPAPRRRVAVLFPGPGALAGGLPPLLSEHPVCTAALAECDAVIRAELGVDLAALLADPLARIDTAQPVTFALSWATWRWLEAMGVVPDALAGHSAGEYAALAAAGVLTMPEALTALIRRGTAMAAAPAGEMAAVFAPAEAVLPLLCGAEIAALNAPRQVVISGRDLSESLAALTEAGISHRRLAIPCAAHSEAMDAAQPALAAALSGLTFRPPRSALYSAMHGARVEAVTAADLVAQLRAPVRFAQTIAAMLQDDITAMVEVGPAPVLSQSISDALALSVFRPEEPDSPLHTLAALLAAGQDLHIGRVMPDAAALALPPPPLQRLHLPIALAQEQHDRASTARPARARLTDADRDLFDAHRASGQPIAPAAWMLEQLFTDRGAPGTLRGVSITAPMSAEGAGLWRIQHEEGAVVLQSRAGHTHQTHLTGTWTSPVPIDAPPEPRGEAVPVAALYEALAAGGLTYGPIMRSLRSVRVDGDELWAELTPTAPVRVQWIDPSVLDGAFQAIVAWLSDEPPGRPFLGFAISEVRLVRPLVGPCRAHLKLRRRHADTLRCDLTLTDALGRPCLALRDFCARRRAESAGVRLLGLNWRAIAPPTGPTRDTRLLLQPTLDELTGRDAGDVLAVTDSAAVAAAARSLGVPRVLVGAPPPSVLRAALSCDAPVLRYDGALRAPELVPLRLEHTEPAPGGVIWIPGGTGGIGAAIAARLAPGRTLVLSGRRPTLDEALRQRLTDAGATVRHLPLDLADPAAVTAAVERLHREHGRLRGIIHCAGTLAGSPGRCPKADGGAALLAALRGVPVDFLALVSSLSALVPSPGQAEYSAANAALDDLIRRVPPSVGRAVTINYGPWSDVGMVADQAEALRRQGLVAMSPQEGVDAFLRALASDAAQVIAVALPDGDLSRLTAAVGVTPPAEPVVAPEPAAAPEVTSAARDVRAILRDLLGRHLKRPMDHLDPTATFAELGVDSLTGVELIRSLESALSVTLYPTLLFEHPVVGDFERQLRAACQTVPAAAPVVPAPARDGVRCHIIDTASGTLTLTTRPAQPLPDDSIRVSVGAWGVNFIDVLARVGLHPAIRDAVFVPGHEIAGTVTAVGSAVTGLRVGDAVMAMPGQGGYAEEVVLPARLAMPVPPGLSIEEAAGLMVTGLTAIACIEDAARLRRGESVLIQSAAGATGMACVQLALHHGATVHGTASTPDKRAALAKLGVHAIDYTAEDFAGAIRRTVGCVDVIVDALAGDAVGRGLTVLADGGRFVEIGAGAALKPDALDPQAMFLRSQSFHGVNLSQLMKNPATLAGLTARLTQAVAQGALRPAIGHRLPFAQAEQAHELLRSRRAIGKIVLVK